MVVAACGSSETTSDQTASDGSPTVEIISIELDGPTAFIGFEVSAEGELPTAQVNWGDDTLSPEIRGEGSLSEIHTYGDGIVEATIVVTVVDEEGSVASAARSISLAATASTLDSVPPYTSPTTSTTTDGSTTTAPTTVPPTTLAPQTTVPPRRPRPHPPTHQLLRRRPTLPQRRHQLHPRRISSCSSTGRGELLRNQRRLGEARRAHRSERDRCLRGRRRQRHVAHVDRDTHVDRLRRGSGIPRHGRHDLRTRRTGRLAAARQRRRRRQRGRVRHVDPRPDRRR